MATPTYKPGHELAAALQALSGRSGEQPVPPTPSPRPAGSPGGGGGWFVPPHLLRLPALREPALAAHDWALQASRNPEDFDSVYHFGLALQVIALGRERREGLRFRLTGVVGCAWGFRWVIQCTLESGRRLQSGWSSRVLLPMASSAGAGTAENKARNLLSAPQELAARLATSPADQLSLLQQASRASSPVLPSAPRLGRPGGRPGGEGVC